MLSKTSGNICAPGIEATYAHNEPLQTVHGTTPMGVFEYSEFSIQKAATGGFGAT